MLHTERMNERMNCVNLAEVKMKIIIISMMIIILIWHFRVAKRKMDDYEFYGGILHVCYAPEYETVDDTRAKLEDRRRAVARRIHQLTSKGGFRSHIIITIIIKPLLSKVGDLHNDAVLLFIRSSVASNAYAKTHFFRCGLLLTTNTKSYVGFSKNSFLDP